MQSLQSTQPLQSPPTYASGLDCIARWLYHAPAHRRTSWAREKPCCLLSPRQCKICHCQLRLPAPAPVRGCVAACSVLADTPGCAPPRVWNNRHSALLNAKMNRDRSQKVSLSFGLSGQQVIIHVSRQPSPMCACPCLPVPASQRAEHTAPSIPLHAGSACASCHRSRHARVPCQGGKHKGFAALLHSLARPTECLCPNGTKRYVLCSLLPGNASCRRKNTGADASNATTAMVASTNAARHRTGHTTKRLCQVHHNTYLPAAVIAHASRSPPPPRTCRLHVAGGPMMMLCTRWMRRLAYMAEVAGCG